MATEINGYEIEHYHRMHDEDGNCSDDCCPEDGCGDSEREPDCTASKHEWTREGMGGCDENPGVWSLGGTTYQFRARCEHCAVVMVVINHGSQRNPYECDSVRFEEGLEDPTFTPKDPKETIR